MSKMFTLFLSTLLTLVLVSGALAQDQDSLLVPPDPNFAKDYLNSVIYGDTTDTGARKNLNRVYVLEIGGIYYFNNSIKTDGWDLKIVAKGDPTPEFSKAVILVGKNDQGVQPTRFSEVHGDVEFKNLYFSCVTEDDKQVNDVCDVYKDSAMIVMENCYVEWAKLFVFRVYSQHTTVKITDSYFNNITGFTGPFNGKVLSLEDQPTESVLMQNNTMVDIQGVMYKGRFNAVKHFKFDHNTVVNTFKWPFHSEYWVNAEITNNVFYNASAYGENMVDASNQDPDGLLWGLINIAPMPDSLLAQAGLADSSDRRMEVRNNSYFFDQDVKDYLAKWWAKDSVYEEPWMNERTQSWFDDDVAYPYLNGEAPIVEDIGLVNYPTADSMIKKMDTVRVSSKNKKKVWFWVDVDDNKVSNPTDRPWDLSYSNSSEAYTAGDDGFPIGDLNWFPDKKNEWITAIGDEEGEPLAREFTLMQNYPNPFNPTTTIAYNLANKTQVQLIIYNVLGQKIKTLVNNKQTAGNHTVVWNGKNEAGVSVPSGVYFYRLETKSGAQQVRKMMLLK